MVLTCTKCNITYPYSDKKKWSRWCKGCFSKYMRAWREKNREHSRSWDRENRKSKIAEHRKRDRQRHYEHIYGVTREEILNMLSNQCGLCAICQKQIGENKQQLDHCHSTGAIRGLLCKNCNVGLGHFKDSVEILRSAVLYLEKHKNVRVKDEAISLTIN